MGLHQMFQRKVKFLNLNTNTVVKNGPKNPMSVVTLKKGFPCAVKKGVIEERYDKYPYYHKTVKIVDYKVFRRC